MRIKLSHQHRSGGVTVTHRANLLVKDVLVLLLGIEPIPRLVRLELRLSQQITQMTGGDRLDDAAFNDFINDRALSPAGHRPAGVFHGLAGHGEDQRELRGGERRRSTVAGFKRYNVDEYMTTAAGFIGENGFDGPLQIGRFFQTLDEGQLFERLLLPAPPLANLIVSEFDDRLNLFIEPACKRQ